MTRALLILNSAAARATAHKWVDQAPDFSRLELKGGKRTLPQNDRFWASLTDFARQVQHHGQTYTPGEWKLIFLHALGRETRFIPALDGKGIVPVGQSSSDLSKAEMSDLLELIYAEGAQRGVVFSDPDTARRESLGELTGRAA